MRSLLRPLAAGAALLAALAVAPTVLGATRHGTHHHAKAKGAEIKLAQPSVKRPLSLLEIGDSLGEDLGMGLHDVLGAHHDVRLYTRAVGDTGLANVNYYNWPAVLETDLRTLHPGLVVVFLGGNDAQGFDVGQRPALFGTAFWKSQYAARVAKVLSEARAAHAAVLWVGMPIMASSTFSSEMSEINAIYAAAVAKDKAAHYYSTWKLFSNSAGAYTQYLPGPNGTSLEVRDADGVHIAPTAGTDLVASAVVKAIDKDFGVRI